MSKDLQDAIKNLGKRKVDTFSANVVSVDKTKGVITVNDGDLEYTNVQLAAIEKANGNRFYIFPKIGSSVLISPINEDIHRLYVEAYSEVEELNLKIGEISFKASLNGIELNGSNYGGIVKADVLKTQIDKNTEILKSIQQAIQSWVPSPNDGGAAFKTALSSVPSMQRADLSGIKNEKVKHGEN